jgi:hypothetical protein
MQLLFELKSICWIVQCIDFSLEYLVTFPYDFAPINESNRLNDIISQLSDNWPNENESKV